MYIVTVIKECDHWDENGASGKPWTVMCEQVRAAEASVKDKTESLLYGLCWENLEKDELQENPEQIVLRASRIEDGEGEADENGKYIADYTVIVEQYANVPVKLPE